MNVQEVSDGSRVTVAIIGAGMAGLLLCQSLRRKGISAEVYERASSKNARFEGYRLGLTEIAQDAIHRSVSQEHWDTFTRLTEQRDGIGGLVIVDSKECNVMWDWTRYSSEPKPRIIPRSDLRDLLISDLNINYSKNFRSLETLREDDSGRARVHFEDGSSVTCDLVVGADGSSSRVKTCLGLENKLDTGVSTIFMFANATEDIVRSMPEYFSTRYWMVIMKDFAIFISTWLPRREGVKDETTNATEGIDLETVDWEKSNIAMGILGPREKFNERLSGRIIDELSAPELKQGFLQILKQENADDRLYGLIQSGIEPTAQYVKFSSCTRPSPDWFEKHKGSPVVLIGDALHSMPPTRGMGGNLALADAADLSERIAAAAKDGATNDIAAALSGFQEEISDRGFEMVGSSVFWARQYIHGAEIFQRYNMESIKTRLELEADPRFGFADNASVEAVRGLLVPPAP